MSKARISSAMRVTTLLALGLGLSACAGNLRPTQKAFAPDEYDQRHPIKLTQAERHLDVFALGHGLDRRQMQDVQGFVREYAANGNGPLTATVPQGPSGHYTLSAIRHALASSGVRVPLQVVPYPADPAMGAAPVRLTFHSLQAKVASKCGLWPSDLGSGSSTETWHNRPYHNLGCAYQTMIAAQVANPVDLVRPRLEGPIDVAKRTKDLEALRKGEDPSTKWSKDDAKIKEAQQ
ncbi:MAG: CpaD family pilus assembly protein [Rhabdaerophilum sp.]